MNDNDKTCGTCKFLHEEGRDKFCRRFPPTAHFVPVQGLRGTQLALQGAMPPTRKENTCGEWQAPSPQVN